MILYQKISYLLFSSLMYNCTVTPKIIIFNISLCRNLFTNVLCSSLVCIGFTGDNGVYDFDETAQIYIPFNFKFFLETKKSFESIIRMKLILTGCTGFIGSEVLSQCLRNPTIISVVALSRRILPDSVSNDPKLQVVIMKDFNSYSDLVLKELAGANACIWYLFLLSLPCSCIVLLFVANTE
jgi:hypothetical protein